MKISNFQFPISNWPARQAGSILIFNIVVMFIFVVVMTGALANGVSQLKILRQSINRELAFQISEAGANYYQWHLAHFPADYSDGGAGGCNPCGPYVHDYVDKDTNQKLGEYSLKITPPPPGSTIVTIESTGYTLDSPANVRKITARYGVPSLAKYAFLTNSDAWIGSGESVNGAFHANGGVRFDGTGNAPITSAKSTYNCTSGFGCSPSQVKPGIWGAAPPATQAFWQFPQPNVDFASITSDLAAMKSSAQSGGIYLPPSSAQGYSIVFKSTGKIDIYKVVSLRPHQTGWDVKGLAHNENLDYNNRSIVAGYADISLPANGLIFVEDRTWVEGTVNGRAMVIAAKLPYNSTSAPSILIPNSIVYLAKDGSHVLGLLGQKDILATYFVPNDLEIDAALIAQNGSIQRYYFPGSIKNSIYVYGSIASFGAWTWSWEASGSLTSGFSITNTTYDGFLLYGPPPSFPVSSSGYQQISWSAN